MQCDFESFFSRFETLTSSRFESKAKFNVFSCELDCSMTLNTYKPKIITEDLLPNYKDNDRPIQQTHKIKEDLRICL